MRDPAVLGRVELGKWVPEVLFRAVNIKSSIHCLKKLIPKG